MSEVKCQELFVESRNAMGTIFTIYLYANDGTRAKALFEAAFEEIERLEETLSNYRETSELSRINRLAARQAVTTDPEVFALLQACLVYSQRSNGAFDVTVGPLMRAWGFFRGKGRYPTDEELRRARESVGWQHVYLDSATRAVRFVTSGVELDLGAIGKGYAVDRVVKVLRGAGVKSALVDAGSSTVHAMNPPPGKNGWTVHVPKPGDRGRMVSTVILRNQSLSTSGSYEKFFQLEGNRFCHVMDPREGTPVQGVLQSTLVACDSTTTDALSNAMFVMDLKQAKHCLPPYLIRGDYGFSAALNRSDQSNGNGRIAWTIARKRCRLPWWRKAMVEKQREPTPVYQPSGGCRQRSAGGGRREFVGQGGFRPG